MNKNIIDEMVNEFYDNFADEINETLFHYATEGSRGKGNATLHERIEHINQTMIGDSMQTICDEESKLITYDEFFMENSTMSNYVIERMLKEFVARF